MLKNNPVPVTPPVPNTPLGLGKAPILPRPQTSVITPPGQINHLEERLKVVPVELGARENYGK